MGEDWSGNVTNASAYPLNVTKCSNNSVRSKRYRSSSVGVNDIDEGLFINVLTVVFLIDSDITNTLIHVYHICCCFSITIGVPQKRKFSVICKNLMARFYLRVAFTQMPLSWTIRHLFSLR